eukprot:1006119-Rhodomonas_salina.3
MQWTEATLPFVVATGAVRCPVLTQCLVLPSATCASSRFQRARRRAKVLFCACAMQPSALTHAAVPLPGGTRRRKIPDEQMAGIFQPLHIAQRCP